MIEHGENTFVVTKEELIKAFRQWEIDSRMGKCVPVEESLAMSADQRAGESANNLLEYLREGS